MFGIFQGMSRRIRGRGVGGIAFPGGRAVPLIDIGEFALQLTGGGIIGGDGLVFSLKTSQPGSLVVIPHLRRPEFPGFFPIHPFILGGIITGARGAVAIILAPRAETEVGPATVEGVAVGMINNLSRRQGRLESQDFVMEITIFTGAAVGGICSDGVNSLAVAHNRPIPLAEVFQVLVIDEGVVALG